MLLNPKLIENQNPETADQYPWCLHDKGQTVALFTSKSIGKELLDTRVRARQLEYESSRNRAMYLGAATRGRVGR